MAATEATRSAVMRECGVRCRRTTHMYAAALFVSWVRHGRSERLAELLGADAAFVTFGRSGDRKAVPVRYARQAVHTMRLLRRTRPDVVIAMGPPLALVVLCRVLHRGPLVLDAHTG